MQISSSDRFNNLFLEDAKAAKANRQLAGIIRSGETGYASELFDSETGDKNYDRKPDDIELMPFYFLFDMPTGKKTAIIALQTFGLFGIATKLKAQLKKYLSAFYPKYTVQLRVIHIGGLFMEKYVNQGNIKTIEGTEYFQPSDSASDSSKEIKCTHIYSPVKRGGYFARGLNTALMNYFKKQQYDQNSVVHSIKELIATDLPDVNELRFEIDVMGTRRKLDLSDLSKTATRYDITDDVSIDASGHPRYESAHGLAKDIVSNDIRKLIKV